MIELIQTEFAKLKRQKIVFTITGVLFLFWAGMTFWTYHVPQESFEELYMKYGSYFAMLLPFLLGLSFIKIYHAEYENNTLKELLQIPVSLSRLFYDSLPKYCFCFWLRLSLCWQTVCSLQPVL